LVLLPPLVSLPVQVASTFQSSGSPFSSYFTAYQTRCATPRSSTVSVTGSPSSRTNPRAGVVVPGTSRRSRALTVSVLR
jgi:hypothetical protein